MSKSSVTWRSPAFTAALVAGALAGAAAPPAGSAQADDGPEGVVNYTRAA